MKVLLAVVKLQLIACNIIFSHPKYTYCINAPDGLPEGNIRLFMLPYKFFNLQYKIY